jgi:hypothetical protein
LSRLKILTATASNKDLNLQESILEIQMRYPQHNLELMLSLMALLVAFFLKMNFAHAADTKTFGIGAILGSPTGVSANYFMSNQRAIDAALAWSLSGHDEFHIHADYLWNRPHAFHIDRAQFDLYFGIGLRTILRERDHHHHHDDDDDDKTSFGPRAPLGMRYNFDEFPIELFAEAALVLELVPDTDVDVDIGFGGRYYF